MYVCDECVYTRMYVCKYVVCMYVAMCVCNVCNVPIAQFMYLCMYVCSHVSNVYMCVCMPLYVCA